MAICGDPPCIQITGVNVARPIYSSPLLFVASWFVREKREKEGERENSRGFESLIIPRVSTSLYHKATRVRNEKRRGQLERQREV